MTVDADLTFPVLWINLAEGSMGIFETEEDLTTWSLGALRGGFHRQLHLFDSQMGHYDVIGTTRGRTVRYRLPFFDRMVHVDLELGPRKTVTIDSIKELMHKAIDVDPDFWDSGEDVADVRRHIDDARTLEQLAAVVS